MSESVPLAATVLLLRDAAAGLEVLMITRHAETVFAGGAAVFPGGRLDPEDGAPALLQHCRAVPGSDAAQMALRVCAIRETFEEAGLLLARRAGSERLLTSSELGAIQAALLVRLGKTADFTALVCEGGLELATDLLVPFAHWITPAIRPRRYDTYFFLAPAPAEQEARHDGHEAVDSIWVAPGQAAADGAAQRVKMIFATRFNLQKLARSTTRDAAFAAARADTIVTVCPEYRETPGGLMWSIPIEAGYGIAETPVKGEVVA
ncbi:MAG TPA: NUDIX hydrolase [Stellaceae bacterium]|nr:NUDIX hydrolase [Stellaceae bacterium]